MRCASGNDRCVPRGEKFICRALLQRNARAACEARCEACAHDAREAGFYSVCAVVCDTRPCRSLHAMPVSNVVETL
jgi:hypothetical protein